MDWEKIQEQREIDYLHREAVRKTYTLIDEATERVQSSEAMDNEARWLVERNRYNGKRPPTRI
ncbi:hypothetical protein GBA63_14445 [Rubrobacter tropicus]|uniref:Uncharacterized protein n=1 Tax=Rubrobacter tropicus TaxID=2653851 RepID=A0A6G8QB41_9ACTN|nr:hypothetical protein [Rubrobacter tropicus]QIN83696.1 hypothetical protein GBA63_14445 [Rubrobacter tropicus]